MKIPETKKVVVFDLDGTLIDSMEDFADVASNVMPRFYPVSRETARQMYLDTSGKPFHHQLETLFPGHPSNADAAKAFEKEKKNNYLDKQLFQGAREMISHLRSKNIKVVVSSNNFQALVDQILDVRGIECDLVLGYQPNFEKGEPHFCKITETLQAERSEITFVGDSLHDAERAQAAGIDFIGKEGTFSSSDFQRRFPRVQVISDLTELTSLF
ncbi:MAG: HAD family hydrolase [Deltaproteobacteria bacterium]|nr:HAD family hydrolase [Deltaproteobacteria bacterium]